MATTGRPADTDSDASALAGTLAEASFVHVAAHADGDALAASALLARGLDGVDVPYQVSLARSSTAAERRLSDADGTTLALGFGAETSADTVSTERPVSQHAYDVASELHDGGRTDATLALAGVLASDSPPSTTPTDTLVEAADASRRPGVGIPTADLADGLAHSTLFHAGISGDEGQAGALLAELELPAELDESAWRRLASRVALDATEAPAGPRAAVAIERALRPYVFSDGPVETADGYADVLDALARAEPGLGVAFALGHADRAAALDVWRETGRRAHRALRRADLDGHDGLVVATLGDDADVDSDADSPLWTVGRLLRDFRSDQPAALAVEGDEAVLATIPATGDDARTDARDALAEAGARAVGGTATHAYAQFEAIDTTDVGRTVRDAL
ncbi:exonuclease RecJ [Halospeciosus flavus]|uniref:Exonuclease RecJ n=1 Tax=Halospeciosus flavus TaxID=3032283 RepID=A0ABD5Z428_9EURY|nr:exonuclease RecJ [Halospeciosus flavus]